MVRRMPPAPILQPPHPLLAQVADPKPMNWARYFTDWLNLDCQTQALVIQVLQHRYPTSGVSRQVI